MAATLWTPEWLRNTYLFGVNLTDDNANDYPEDMWVQAMDTAVEWVAAELDIAIPAATFTERHDFITPQTGLRTFVQTTKFPIKAITRLSLMVGVTRVLDIPADWIANYRHNQVEIVPSANTIATYPLTALGFWQVTSYRGEDIPGAYEIVYSAGFNLTGTASTYSQVKAGSAGAWVPSGIAFDGPLTVTLAAPAATAVTFTIKGANKGNGKLLDGRKHGSGVVNAPETVTIGVGQSAAVSVNEWSSISSVTWTTHSGDITFSGASLNTTGVDIPRDILDVMGKRAAISVLITAGDLIAGAGIANKSIGIDGVSQSIGTTASPENSGYSAHIGHYEKQLKQDLRILRRKYHGISLGVC
jgi:hypothetical protein